MPRFFVRVELAGVTEAEYVAADADEAAVTPMPKGAGAVKCPECGATASADGRGSPITLRHAPRCPGVCGLCHVYDGHALSCPTRWHS